jgi:hypothetical protein
MDEQILDSAYVGIPAEIVHRHCAVVTESGMFPAYFGDRRVQKIIFSGDLRYQSAAELMPEVRRRQITCDWSVGSR